MALCAVCHQSIKESVTQGRKLIFQIHTNSDVQSGVGRYLTILSVKCGCGERIERRYENRPMRESIAS
jgi:hypothetical protein